MSIKFYKKNCECFLPKMLIFLDIYDILIKYLKIFHPFRRFHMTFLLNTATVQEPTFWEKLATVFKNFHPVWDTIDILLLASLFFVVFQFLKTRKSVAIFVGVGIVIVLMTVAKLAQFEALSSILTAVASGGPIILVIIFQQEIRDVLERMGSSSIRTLTSFNDRKKKREQYFSIIENICSAVSDLSHDSIGALIVIERTTRLSDVVDSGVTINADVNASLIKNLFFNKAPLHDGAVIVSEGRIAAAGCFLPLTRRTDLNTDLGTRHRAALGMAEASDAMIIVVSEETGTISVAVDGSLNRDITADELKQFMLENLLRSTLNLEV